MNKSKLILLIVISIFLLFCIIFKSDYTISHADIETSLNPGIFVKFKSPSLYGKNSDGTKDATSIIAYIIKLKPVTDDAQYLKEVVLYTDRGYMPEYSLSWRDLSDTDKIMRPRYGSKTDIDLCIKIDRDNIRELKPMQYYRVGITAVNNFFQFSPEHVVDTNLSIASCANIPSTMCWAKFSNDFSLPTLY